MHRRCHRRRFKDPPDTLTDTHTLISLQCFYFLLSLTQLEYVLCCMYTLFSVGVGDGIGVDGVVVVLVVQSPSSLACLECILAAAAASTTVYKL